MRRYDGSGEEATGSGGGLFYYEDAQGGADGCMSDSEGCCHEENHGTKRGLEKIHGGAVKQSLCKTCKCWLLEVCKPKNVNWAEECEYYIWDGTAIVNDEEQV